MEQAHNPSSPTPSNMSFFPYPESHHSKVTDQTFNMDQSRLPPTPVPSQGEPSEDVDNNDSSRYPSPASSSVSYHNLPAPTASWPAMESRGLSLQILSAYPQSHASPSSMTNATTAWPSTYDPSLPASTLAGSASPHPAVTYCTPYPPILPSIATPWNDMRTTNTSFVPVYESTASPDHSPFSRCSQPSTCASSPHPCSEIEQSNGSPPYITIDGSMDYSRARQYSHADHSSQILVRPHDIYNSHAEYYDQASDAGCAPMKVESIEESTPQQIDSPSREASVQVEESDAAIYRNATFEELLAKQRRFTTEATMSCACNKCGKLFQRTYNLKQHMETHKRQRSYAHVCAYQECGRSFIRRTDLNRHVRSVHEQDRKWECHMCEQTFARKDTLRRHVLDGCAKRPQCQKQSSKLRRAQCVRKSHSPY